MRAGRLVLQARWQCERCSERIKSSFQCSVFSVRLKAGAGAVDIALVPPAIAETRSNASRAVFSVRLSVFGSEQVLVPWTWLGAPAIAKTLSNAGQLNRDAHN